MRIALLASFCLAAVIAQAQTAYDALGLVGKQRGEKILDRVTEVRGINGSPKPREWVIVTTDREARGGVREFGVQGKKIVSERTPAGRSAGTLMNMNQLNLDSDGAQIIAEREATKAGFAYDYADYVLRAGTQAGAPIWELRLIDEKSGDTATLVIAADKGVLLSAEGLTNSPRTSRPSNNNPPPVARNQERPPKTAGHSSGAPLQRAGDSINNFFERVGRHMVRRKNQVSDGIHNLFTGDDRDTAGPHSSRPGDDEEDRPAKRPPAPPTIYRDQNGTDYYRPRD